MLFRSEFGAERSSWLQLGLGELRQVGHDRVLVHVGVDNLLWGDHLGNRDTRRQLLCSYIVAVVKNNTSVVIS